MPFPARVNGGDFNSNSPAAGRGRQRLKLGALGYAHSRHGIDADLDRARVAVMILRKRAVEFVMTLPGVLISSRRYDLLIAQGDSTLLEFAAIAYASARHGVDADVGMAREGLVALCQEAIDFVESVPREEPKRPTDPHLQIGNGA